MTRSPSRDEFNSGISFKTFANEEIIKGVIVRLNPSLERKEASSLLTKSTMSVISTSFMICTCAEVFKQIGRAHV